MKAKDLVFYCCLLILPVLIYVSGFSDQLIWDSRPLILENELLKGNVSICKAFLSGYWQTTSQRLEGGYDYYRPLMIASFMLEKRVWGIDPIRLQLTNLLIFLFAGYIFYLILCRLGPSLSFARNVALLFVFHPLHLDNINWTVGRCDLLMLLGAFSCWLLLDLYFQEHKKWQLLLAPLAFLFALLAKEAALFFLPFFGALYFSKFCQKKFWPVGALMLFISAIFWLVKSFVIGRGDFPVKFFFSLSETFQVITGTIGYYGKAIIFPFGFAMFLPADQVTTKSYFFWGIIFTVALIILGYFTFKKQQLILPFLLIVIFILAYLIMIFTPLFPFSISTRYMLLPTGGVCFLVGIGLSRLKKDLAIIFLIVILVSFSLSIFSRQAIYRSELNFWQSVLVEAPKNSFLLLKTAQQRYLKGELLAAEKLLHKALGQKMNPETALAITVLLTEIKRKQAFYREAKEWIERGLSLPVKEVLRTQLWKENYLLALARGDLSAAEFSLQKISSELKRKDLPQMLINLYLAFGEWEKALQIVERFETEERSRQMAKIEQQSKIFSAYSLLEKSGYFEQQGIFRLAYAYARQIEKTELRQHFNLIRLALLAGEEADAHQLIGQLLIGQKIDYRVLNSIGLIYLQVYRPEETINYFRQSLQLKADQPDLIAQLQALEKESRKEE